LLTFTSKYTALMLTIVFQLGQNFFHKRNHGRAKAEAGRSFQPSNQRDKIGQKFEITEDILTRMWAQMVDIVLHLDSHDFKEIVKSHIHLDIKISDFDDIIKLFPSGSKSEFVGKAKPVLKKLMSLDRLYTE